jgi:signal transduction histidine kinase
VDLTEVAEEVVSDLEARIEEVGGRVEVGELPTIEADRLQMRQLLQNLIGNGLKFHKGGEAPVVEVRAEVVEERGRGGSEAPAGEGVCHIRVKDNGIGFDEEHLERIFMPFQRLHGRNVYEGTGMGLAICRKVVERHGGRITAESAPGRGATFTVTLPLVQPGRDSWTGRDELGHHATPGR